MTQSGAADYWTLSTTTVDYYVWYPVSATSGAPYSTDPAPGGLTAIAVAQQSNDKSAANMAGYTATAIDAVVGFGATSAVDVVTVTNDVAGVVADAADVDAGVTVNVTTQGVAGSATASDSLIVYDASANENLKVSVSSLAATVGS